jgi:hypothetical protein
MDFRVERQLTVSHFRSALLKRFLPLSLLVRMDSLAQLTGDWWQLSPSVFVRARATGASPLSGQGVFFRCPECGHYPLDEGSQAILCPACSRRWAIRDGIYDFKNPQDPKGF